MTDSDPPLFEVWAKCVECKHDWYLHYRTSRNAWDTGWREGNTYTCPNCGFHNTYGGNADYELRPVPR